MWKIRNEFNEKIRIQFFETTLENRAYVDLSDDEIELHINQSDLSFLIDITERSIQLTDDLVREFYNFFNEFPLAASSKVKLKLIKKLWFYSYI